MSITQYAIRSTQYYLLLPRQIRKNQIFLSPMKLQEKPVSQAENAILVHNVAFVGGQPAVRKGTRLTRRHLSTLQELGHETIIVAILEEGDILEDEAASQLAQALTSDVLRLSRAKGGRINLRAACLGMLEVDPTPLMTLNLTPGITLATRPQYTVAAPGESIATLKIIPLAVPRRAIQAAIEVAQSNPHLLNLRPLPANRRAALLLTGEPNVHPKLRADFEPPTRDRLTRLGVALTTVITVNQNVADICAAAGPLAAEHDLLIVAGQTSIMAVDDIIPSALSKAGAEVLVQGAPVEPGNLLALAYFPTTPVLCAPGCARNPEPNIIDLVLPRLLLGDQLTRHDIAAYGLGGLL